MDSEEKIPSAITEKVERRVVLDIDVDEVYTYAEHRKIVQLFTVSMHVYSWTYELIIL